MTILPFSFGCRAQACLFQHHLMCSETSSNERITGSLVKSVFFAAKDKRKETTADIKERNDWSLKQRFAQ